MKRNRILYPSLERMTLAINHARDWTGPASIVFLLDPTFPRWTRVEVDGGDLRAGRLTGPLVTDDGVPVPEEILQIAIRLAASWAPEASGTETRPPRSPVPPIAIAPRPDRARREATAIAAVIDAADAWLDDTAKGLGSRREFALAEAARALRSLRDPGDEPPPLSIAAPVTAVSCTCGVSQVPADAVPDTCPRCGAIRRVDLRSTDYIQAPWEELDGRRRMYGAFAQEGESFDPLAIFRTEDAAERWLSWQASRGDDSEISGQDFLILPVDQLDGIAWNSLSEPAPVLP